MSLEGSSDIMASYQDHRLITVRYLNENGKDQKNWRTRDHGDDVDGLVSEAENQGILDSRLVVAETKEAVNTMSNTGHIVQLKQ